MSKSLGKLFTEWDEIFSSVMPGGDNWDEAKSKAASQEGRTGEKRMCLVTCPNYGDCCKKGTHGPKGICETGKWREAPANPFNLVVILHVIENFDFYNRDDLRGLKEDSASILELRRKVLCELGKAVFANYHNAQ